MLQAENELIHLKRGVFIIGGQEVIQETPKELWYLFTLTAQSLEYISDLRCMRRFCVRLAFRRVASLDRGTEQEPALIQAERSRWPGGVRAHVLLELIQQL